MDRQVENYLKGHGYAVEASAGREDAGAEPGFLDWYETRVLGLDSGDYARDFWREARATGRTAGHVPRTLGTLLRDTGSRHGGAWDEILLALALLGGAAYPFWLLARLLAKRVSRLRRGTYYGRERERRWRLADARAAIRVRRTANPCPTPDAVRAAWRLVRATRGREHVLAVLRCGALLEDLECYVDNRARVVRGVSGVRGRAPGIKGLFREKAPDLLDDYKNVMRCKALAKRYRQAVGCPDPVPTAAVLPAPGASDFAAERSSSDPWTGETVGAGGVAFPLLPCLRDADALAAWMRTHGNTAYLRAHGRPGTPGAGYAEGHLLPAGAREDAARILGFGDGTLVAVEAAVALRIDPACAGVCVRAVRSAGGRRAPSTPRRVREWLAGAAGRRARGGAAA